MRQHKRLATVFLLAVMAISALLTASLTAQSAQPQPGQTQQPAAEQEQSQTEPATGDAAAQETTEPLPDIDSQPIEPGARSNGRFIPSEQISQDLGVSFPVDI